MGMAGAFITGAATWCDGDDGDDNRGHHDQSYPVEKEFRSEDD